MNHLQVSFLGRVPRGEKGYEPTLYAFPGQAQAIGSPFFAAALIEHLRREENADMPAGPDQLLLLGTSASMWDALEHPLDAPGDEALHLTLMEAVEAGTVNEEMLRAIEPGVSRAMGLPVTLGLIPYGIDEAEQVSVLETIANACSSGDAVTLDLTHGFRHLPLLGLLSALFLRMVRDVAVRGIWYGALDMKRDRPVDTGDGLAAPVLRLDKLLDIADWTSAFSGFDRTGDLRGFLPLLDREGAGNKLRQALRKGVFLESIADTSGGAKAAQDGLQRLRESAADEGSVILSLMRPSLEERLSWAQSEGLYARQRRLARFHFEHGDYLRATLFGQEAVVTQAITAWQCNLDHAARDQARKDLNEEYARLCKKRWGELAAGARERRTYLEGFVELTRLRNAIAHGSNSSHAEITAMLATEEGLRKRLAELFTVLFEQVNR
jgi:CRISPR-associated Csx2 family protein